MRDFNKILNRVRPSDTAILYNYRYRKIARAISDICRCSPSRRAIDFCSDRIEQAKYLDCKGFYPMCRVYHNKGNIDMLPGYVYKVGNYHAGEAKHFGNGTKIYVPYSTIGEEYVKGRSIRILWIHPGDVYAVEHINNKSWIANVDPDEEIVYNSNAIQKCPILSKLAADTKSFIDNELTQHGIISLTWGFDYIVGDKTGLLEINDMCGIPHNEEADKSFVDSILEACSYNS
jgi:hypothetical protein